MIATRRASRKLPTIRRTPKPIAVHTVKVTAKEYRFVLSTSKVPAGRVKFVIKDTGSSQHDFAIAGHTSKTIGPEQSTTMTVTLRKGKYPYRCTVDSHAELGMKGTLTVD